MATYSLHFTKEAIEKIICPRIKQDFYIDTKEHGLILVASCEDSKIFYLRTASYHKITLGEFPYMSLVEARAKAAELKTQIGKGINHLAKLAIPNNQIDNESTELTFQELLDKYIKEHCKRRNMDEKQVITIMDRYGKHFYNMKISTITRQYIQKTFNDISNRDKLSANRFLVLLRTIFNKAIIWEVLEKNPTHNIVLHKEKPREKFIITQEEMSRLLDVINAESNKKIADFFLLLLFTGARKGDVLSMRWKDINFENMTWYLHDQAQRIYLVKDAITILARRQKENNIGAIWVFPSNNSSSDYLHEPKKEWQKICYLAGINNLMIHDLRSSFRLLSYQKDNC
ncbi:MAG: tyrosine-type recombinase/integrase [Rickettsia endosymbiont of Pseudomimeciton antennatum]|nr:tyrosine-type recombinase/integrase [Rickettsia endosymbiont of Pseudomimeciton antennatum]